MQALLTQFREATKASHEMLDAAFGSVDLSTREGYARFLSGHAMGLEPLQASFRAFVEGELGLDCPDYTAMLRDDLAALGLDAATLPRIAAPAVVTPAATGYVISGSRLGLTMIRRGGYWGQAHGLPSAYMEDERGIAIWKEAAAHLKQATPETADAQHECAAAVAVFETFRRAFDASAPAPVR